MYYYCYNCKKNLQNKDVYFTLDKSFCDEKCIFIYFDKIKHANIKKESRINCFQKPFTLLFNRFCI